MGFFSSIFDGGKSSGTVSGRNPGSGWVVANRFNKAKGGFAGGYGAITFGNIMNAHSSADEIVGEFELDQEEAEYGDCYERAYQEEYVKAEAEANLIEILTWESIDADDLIDEEAVEAKAYNYAIELAER